MKTATVGTSAAPAGTGAVMTGGAVQTIGWSEVMLRSLPSLTVVAATILVMNNPRPETLGLLVLSGVVTLIAWLPFGRK